MLGIEILAHFAHPDSMGLAASTTLSGVAGLADSVTAWHSMEDIAAHSAMVSSLDYGETLSARGTVAGFPVR